jgi:hypothetical protein
VINNDMLARLNAITHDPAWREIVVSRLAGIYEKADYMFHKVATAEDFKYHQGKYEMIKEVYDMFKEPRNLVDDGIKNIAPKSA